MTEQAPPHEEMKRVLARLSMLERQNRRMKAVGVGVLLILGLAYCAEHAAEASAVAGADVVIAREFRVVDEDGREWGRFGVPAKDNELAYLDVSSFGSSARVPYLWLAYSDTSGQKGRVSLVATDIGPEIQLVQRGQAALLLRVNGSNPFMELSQGSTSRATFGIAGTRSTLQLANENGRGQVLFMTGEDEPMVMVKDSEGNPMFFR